MGADPDLHPLLRRWDHRPPADAYVISVMEGLWIPLEDGVEVRFSTNQTAQYRRGDHWLIPARSIPAMSSGQGTAAAHPLQPHGVAYRFADPTFPTRRSCPVPGGDRSGRRPGERLQRTDPDHVRLGQGRSSRALLRTSAHPRRHRSSSRPERSCLSWLP